MRRAQCFLGGEIDQTANWDANDDYTATRERAGPEEFLKGYRGYLQADAYGGYDAFFKDPTRGLIEVGCWAHARRYFYKALESDQARMGPALLLIARLYRVEEQARPLAPEDRLGVRQLQSRPLLDKLRDYLLEIQAEVLPKSPEGRAVRYTLKNWTALTRYCEDGDLEIDNNATNAARGILQSIFSSASRRYTTRRHLPEPVAETVS